jgi:DNA-binding HxlR family transcriptional regulator
MTAIKTSSTRNFNKEQAELHCPVTYVMNRIGGHWKPIILYQLIKGTKRYSELKKGIPSITEKMLIQHLKQLQEDNIVTRETVAVMPPVVTYKLSPTGKGLVPVLKAMVRWALQDEFRYPEKD